jgi:catechol 2,3-dioxygenase-like lactoylglutathione lyase family enzyme
MWHKLRVRHLFISGLLLAAGVGLGVADETSITDSDTVAPVLYQASMNVFRRHRIEPEAMFEFYGEVLGLEQLASFAVGRGGLARFQAGASELKLTGIVDRRDYVAGSVRDATGLRLIGFFIRDREALLARFAAHNLPSPEFQNIPGSNRSVALTQDPDGQWVELIAAPKEQESTYQQIEIGLTVSDMDRSRAFYRSFVGLEELDPVHDPLFATMKYSFRHGSTIISLRSFGSDLPADTGSGGIQYVVSNVDHVNALAQARGATIDQPLSGLAGFALRPIWLDDPDGITNYFAETTQAREARDAPAGR